MGSPSSRRVGSPLRAAIIGCGQIAGGYDRSLDGGPVLTHAKAYRGHPETVLVAVADPDGGRARAFAERWSVERSYEDPGRMLEEVRPDLVSICAPTEAHASWLRAALVAGARGVWCEKPLASTLAEAASLVEAYETAGVALAVNYLRRWDPALEPLALRCREAPAAIRAMVAYGKGLQNNASHALDLLLDWVGPVAEARALSALVDYTSTDPTVTAHLRFASGAEAVLVGHDDRPVTLWEIDVLGHGWRTRLVRAGARIEDYVSREDATFPGYREFDPTPTVQDTGLYRAMALALDNLVEAVRGERPLRSTGRTALAVLALCDRIIRQLTPNSEKD